MVYRRFGVKVLRSFCCQMIDRRQTKTLTEMTINMKVFNIWPVRVRVGRSDTKSVKVMLIARKKKNDISLK